MSHFLRFVFFSSVLLRIYAVGDHRELFVQDNVADIEALFSCVNVTAVRLFDNGTRIGVICYKCGYLENEIIKIFMETRLIVVSDRPMPLKNRRHVSYVVFANELFTESRQGLLKKGAKLHTLQYLFVSTATEETVISFATDLWYAGFRDIAFLTRNVSGGGTIQIPVMKKSLILKSVGYCSSIGNSLDDIRPYASDFYRFCAKKPCTLLYDSIGNDTETYWREEDKAQLQATKSYQTMGTMLIDRFTSLYGIEKHRMEVKPSWREAAEKLANGELDIVIGLMPTDLEAMENMKVVCWFRDRKIVFSAKVPHRMPDEYPVLKLLTPFHYSVWVCVIVTLLVYIFLLWALRKLAAMGLITERLNFMQIYEVMLGQGVEYPRKTSLRSVLALWMIFSLNLNIIYDSVFTSSLTDMNKEILLKNLKELRDSGMPVAGPAITQGFLNDSDDPVIRDLRDRYMVIKDADQMLDAILSNQTMAVIQHITVDRINWANRMNRSLRIYTLARPVLSFPVLFYTRPAHPYRAPLEHTVTEYRESGLLHKWIRYYVIEEDKSMINNYNNEDDNSGILTKEHLGAVFEFFFMCQAITVLVFLLELFRARVFKAH